MAENQGNGSHGGGSEGNQGHGGGHGGPGGDQGPGGGQGGGGGNSGPGHEPKVTITVDDVKKEVRPGRWLVSDLKAAVGVDAAKVLAQITPNGLVDLEDDKHVEVHQGQRFMSHARTGGSA